MENNDELDINYDDIQKMVFIYNALNDGWKVKKIGNEKYELIKDNEHITKEGIKCLTNVKL